jgi:hypothetical protein
MTRDDLTAIDRDALTYHPASLASLLTTFATDFLGEGCPRTAS